MVIVSPRVPLSNRLQQLTLSKGGAYDDARVDRGGDGGGLVRGGGGVGAGAAKKIIAWREAHGPFKHLHDLEKVPGVGRDVLEKNHGRIAVK